MVSYLSARVSTELAQLYCVSCYSRIDASKAQVVEGQEAATRAVIQKAVVAVCSQPIFGLVLPSLTASTDAYFASGR